jgi:hypothetical protein
MTKYQHNLELTITTSAHMLPHILQVIEGCAQIVKVVAIPTPDLPTQNTMTEAQTPKKRYTNGFRNKGISGEELLLQILANKKPVHYDIIVNQFVSNGFARNSASPVISRLLKENRIIRPSAGIYQIA